VNVPQRSSVYQRSLAIEEGVQQSFELDDLAPWFGHPKSGAKRHVGGH
jgi:hypothetical protein